MTCQQYVDSKWCTSNGKKGSGWKNNYGEFEQFATEHGSAVDVCCECGGRGMKGSVSTKPEVVSDAPKDESTPSPTKTVSPQASTEAPKESVSQNESSGSQKTEESGSDGLSTTTVALMIGFGLFIYHHGSQYELKKKS